VAHITREYSQLKKYKMEKVAKLIIILAGIAGIIVCLIAPFTERTSELPLYAFLLVFFTSVMYIALKRIS
jgi:hypothetical protein